MPVYQIDYYINNNLLRQVIKKYDKGSHQYKIFIYVNIFNIGFNKQKKTLEEALDYVFDIINKAQAPNFWEKPSYIKMLLLPETNQ